MDGFYFVNGLVGMVFVVGLLGWLLLDCWFGVCFVVLTVVWVIVVGVCLSKYCGVVVWVSARILVLGFELVVIVVCDCCCSVCLN